jgi:hypothetical protein
VAETGVGRSLFIKTFSRKGAKAQRKTFRNAAALCVFAPLREKPSPITQNHLCKRSFIKTFSRKGAKAQRKTLETRQRFASLRLCVRNLPRHTALFFNEVITRMVWFNLCKPPSENWQYYF